MRQLLRAIPHHTSTQKCNVVGCIEMQGSICGHTQDRCPYCIRNHIVFTSMYTLQLESTSATQERRKREPAGRTTQATEQTLRANLTVLSLTARAPAWIKWGGSKKEMPNAEEGAGEAVDITMVESMMQTTRGMTAQSWTGSVTAMRTSIEPGNGMEVGISNVYHDPTQLCQVIWMDHGSARDGGGTGGRCGVSARTDKRKSRNWNQPLGRWH